MKRRCHTVLVLIGLVCSGGRACAAAMEPIRIADDHRGFVLARSGIRFVPWGFNYDRDENSRLLEDYWYQEWAKVVADFQEMKALGANLVRVHLQFGKFMKTPDQADAGALNRLANLLSQAEQTGLYLDLTGLGCYRKRDVPAWYDSLTEAERWIAQACFWRAIAARCAGSPAVFCYDLMNEPVVPGGRRQPGEWLGPPLGEFHYVQVITLDQKERSRPAIARAWIDSLTRPIRSVDTGHLVTVGLVDWSLDRPGLTSGFVPAAIAPVLDFLCVHLYPSRGKVDEAIGTLEGFATAGMPVVIEETFPLMCGAEEFEGFLKRSKPRAAGWVGFYWGKTPDELRQSKTIADAMTLAWLEIFRKGKP